jgi:hypothetical protein
MGANVRHPLVQSEVTPGWLTAVLREAGVLTEGGVQALAVSEIGVGRGYVCLTLRIVPTYDKDDPALPSSFVLKMPTFVDIPGEENKLMVREFSATEAHWYRDLSAECPIRVPRAYWQHVDALLGKSWVLLEDLGDLRTIDQRTGCSLDEAEMAVSALARVQAHWWGRRDVERLAWMTSADYQGERIQRLVAQNLAACVRLYDGYLDPAFQSFGHRYGTGLRAVANDAAASGSTLVHGDYRAENFLFGPRYSPDELVVLDWQLVHWGSGLRDLAYLLGQSLTLEMRRAHERDLVDRYYEGLRAGGVANYSRAACWDDYRRGLLVSSAFFFQGGNAVEEMVAAGAPPDADAEGRRLFEAWLDAAVSLLRMVAERSVLAIVDNEAQRLLP